MKYQFSPYCAEDADPATSSAGGQPTTPADPAESSVEDQVSRLTQQLKDERAGRQKLLGEVKDLRAKFSSIDPDEYVALKTAAEQQQKERQEAKGNYEEALKTQTERFAKSEEGYKAQIASLSGEVDRLFAVQALSNGFAEAGGSDRHRQLYLLAASQYYKVVLDGGNRQFEFMDREGLPLHKKTGEPVTSPLDLAVYLREETESGVFFAPTTPQGTGVTGSARPASGNQPIRIDPTDGVAIGKHLNDLVTGKAVFMQ